MNKTQPQRIAIHAARLIEHARKIAQLNETERLIQQRHTRLSAANSPQARMIHEQHDLDQARKAINAQHTQELLNARAKRLNQRNAL